MYIFAKLKLIIQVLQYNAIKYNISAIYNMKNDQTYITQNSSLDKNNYTSSCCGIKHILNWCTAVSVDVCFLLISYLNSTNLKKLF